MILFCQESYTHFIQSETSSHKVTGSIRKHPLSKLYPWGIFQRKTVQHYFNTRSGEQPFFFKQWCKESNFSASYYLSWTYSIRTHPLSVLFLYLTGYTHVQHIQHDIPPNKLIRIKSMKQPKPCSIDSFFLFFFLINYIFCWKHAVSSDVTTDLLLLLQLQILAVVEIKGRHCPQNGMTNSKNSGIT